MAISAEVLSSFWQPIGLAPRNGCTILVCRNMPGWGWVRGYAYWVDERGISGWIAKGLFDPPGELGLAHPTHWMPIPLPPIEAQSDLSLQST